MEVKSLIQKERPIVTLLKETKFGEKKLYSLHSKIWGQSKMVVESSRGASGGLCTMWNPTKLQLVSSTKNTH